MNKFKKIIFSFLLLVAIANIVLFLCHDKLKYSQQQYETEKNVKGIKMLIISDFHREGQISSIFSKQKQFEKDFSKEIKKKYDVLLMVGDMIDERTTEKSFNNICKIFDEVNKMDDVKCIYYVNGNHERESKFWPKLKTKIAKNEKIKYLDNSYDTSTFESYKINFFGLSDPVFFNNKSYSPFSEDDYSRYGDSIDIFDKKFKSVLEKKKEELNILIVHRPEIGRNLCKKKECGFDLIISGHTHGGQMFCNNDKPEEIISNSKQQSTKLYISHGLGYSKLAPLRINCSPEILFIEIVKEEKKKIN